MIDLLRMTLMVMADIVMDLTFALPCVAWMLYHYGCGGRTRSNLLPPVPRLLPGGGMSSHLCPSLQVQTCSAFSHITLVAV